MRSPPRQKGFILVMTIWLLAAIAIAAAFFAGRVQKSLQLAQQRQSGADAQVALSDARAELLFRLATVPMTQQGMGIEPGLVVLDDRPYALGEVLVQIQDARGLINLNRVPDEQLRRFLLTLKVPVEQHDRLIDTLRDYMDADDLLRLNGAEAPQYRELGLDPPSNAPLVSPVEVRRILAWRDLPQWAAGSEAYDWVTADESLAVNPNSAPWQVLTSLPGVTEELAKAIVKRRQLGSIDAALLEQALGVQMGGVPPLALPFPSNALRLTLRSKGVPWALRYNVKLTPRGANAPWQITNFYRLERNVNAELSSDAASAPVFPSKVMVSAAPSLLPAPGSP